MNYELIIADIKNLKNLRKRKQEVSNEIIGIDHKLYGIHGGSFEDINYKGEEFRQFFHGGYVSELDKIERSEELAKLKLRFINEERNLIERIDQVESVMASLPPETKQMIEIIYWRRGWKYAKNYYHRSYSSLQRQMRKDIERL